MNCADLKLSIIPYLDGELEHGEHAAAEEHLASCERCRVQLAETRQLLLVLKEVPFPAPSPVYWASILPRVHSALERKKSPSLAEILLRAVFPATATVAAFLIGIFLLPLQHDYSLDELAAGLRQTVPAEMQLLEEQISFTVAANPLAPRDVTDLKASGDQEQILTIFHGDEPALSSLVDEHLQAFDALSDKELGQLLAFSDNSAPRQ